MSSTIRSSPPATATVPARPAATVDAQQAEEYRRGREEGTTWARTFATTDELRGFVTSYEARPDGEFANQYWRGFFDAAQEILNGSNRGQAAK